MSNAMRRGGIPGPESRTGLTRPSMTEAEFERRIGTQAAQAEITSSSEPTTAGRDGIRSAFHLGGFVTAAELRGSSRPNPDGSNGCSPSRRIWTRNSGSTPSTWGRTAPRSSMTCCDPSSPRWCFMTLATAAVVEAPRRCQSVVLRPMATSADRNQVILLTAVARSDPKSKAHERVQPQETAAADRSRCRSLSFETQVQRGREVLAYSSSGPAQDSRL